MVRLVPALTTDIPVHPGTVGSEDQRLVVEKHEFPAPSQPVKTKIAFVFSHANGFHKEMLHPLMRCTIDQFRELPQYNQTHFDFYAWDARNHGDSARLNKDHVHIPTYSWFDHAMDTMQLIEEMKLKENYDKLIGVGHSFGGSAMILAEFMNPKTFDGLCIPEPVIGKVIVPHAIRSQFPAIKGALKRRDTWKSREECFKSLDGRPFWRDLHPEVLQNYINYGLYDTPEGTVKLKCPKLEEHLVYMAGVFGSASAFGSLRSLTIPVHISHAKGSTFTDPSTADDIKAQSPMLTNSMIKGSHMVPGEHPDLLVPDIVQLTNRAIEFSENRAKL
ncbi:Alpha/Beta hydrolase protein [Zychaea mexicana]|uniref:Alpha/Beta hydrolase protein n=1 Tax=Zychaea mexicana TaxID=64656 RepID=UPI0022FE2B5A|nr:Alpha/Beta hydrolase protein [Zychaea mexicana]KAI9492137.1 Alpha/Beta hydrolase protein [Zychaea mexicana]